MENSQSKVPDLREKNVLEDPGIAVDVEHPAAVTKEYSAWDVYNEEAKKVDTELVIDWRDSLNSLLLFAAIFAAVLTAFIIESKKLLQQDPADVMVDVMIFYTNTRANGTFAPYIRPNFQPDSSAITINCLFFASLSSSLVTAFASVVALQWVADYDAAITRGGSSPEDRAKRRQFRYAGVVGWKMGEIIAALPLLLYCSFVLYLGGLILWMWLVNQIVGFVVAGVTAVAALLYGLSTALSAAVASAPFRTPLSRWIFQFIRILSSAVYLITQVFRPPATPIWPEKQRLSDTAPRRREDKEVYERSELAMEALVWLANQLSISQDTYHRLLLLASELPKLEPKHFHSYRFGEAPWPFIFDLLGWKNLKIDQNTAITNEDRQAISVLSKCYEIPAVYEMVSPTDSMLYISDDTQEEYWSQWCDTAQRQWSSISHTSRPNSLFLLLRDVPLPSRNRPNELDLTIRLSRWRNSPHKPHGTLSDVVSPVPASTTSDASLVIVSRFLGATERKFWFSRDEDSLFITIVRRMVPSLVSGNTNISPTFLDLLRWRFEAMLVKEGADMDTKFCLFKPLLYRDALRQKPEFGSLHSAFTLLLSRSLASFSGSERVRRVKEIIIMLWIAPVYRGRITTEKVLQRQGMESFFEANRSSIMGWIKNSDAIPHVNEILRYLAEVVAEDPQIGPLWRGVHPPVDADPRLIEALEAFDCLIRTPVTPAQHRVLVDLVCLDFELGPPEAFKGYFNANRSRLLNRLRDPCLRTLGNYMAGLDSKSGDLPFVGPMSSWKDSWIRIAVFLMKQHEGTDSPSILRLQASVWPAISDHPSGLAEQALRQPKALVHLQRMFRYPVPCVQHYDGEGHLLLHIFQRVPNCVFSVDLKARTNIPMRGRSFNVLQMLLVLDGYDTLPLAGLLQSIDQQCLSHLLEMTDTVKNSQLSLLTLASDLTAGLVANQTSVGICSEDIAALSICAIKALGLPCDQRVTSIIPRLVARTLQAKDSMLELHYRSTGENEMASGEATTATNRLMTYLATMTIFGRQNSRMVPCVRPSKRVSSSVVDWLFIYTG